MTGRWRVRPADRPTRRETGSPIPRRHQPPPTHCGASRRNGRDLIIATRPAHQPLPSLHQRQRRKRYKRSLNRQCYPPHFMRECIPPNLHDPQRAKGSLDRRSKRLSFPHFFLRRKKCGRRRLAPAGGVPIPPAASAATYPLRCFAPQWARFDNRHSTSAPTPTLTAVSGSGASGTSDPPNRQRYPPLQFREASTAKFALTRPAPRDP